MNHQCFNEDELAALVTLEPDHPRREEAALCPRCDSLLASVTAFLAGDDEIPEAEMQRADSRLSALIDQESVRSSHPRRMKIISKPFLNLALTTAAAAVLLVIFLPRTPTLPSGTLRGGAHSEALPEGIELIFRPGPTPGSLQVAWPAVPGADRFQVELFNAAFDTLGTMGPLTQPAATISKDLLLQAGSSAIYLQVKAFSGKSVTATSRLLLVPSQ